MSKHTPGPWQFWEARDHYYWVRENGRDANRLIVRVEHMDGGLAETEANARLVAAAPAMLQALKEFVKLRKGDLGPDLEPLERAIAKAEGRE